MAIGIGVIIGNQTTGGGGGGGTIGNGGTQANLWINPGSAGASPSRCSPICNYDSTHAYGTIPAAYSAATVGDSVLMKSGTFTSAQTITVNQSGLKPNGQSCHIGASLAGCIVFQPETGATVTFAVQNPGTVTPIIQLFICAKYVYLKNVTFTDTTFTETATGHVGHVISNTSLEVGKSDNSCGWTTPPHDNVFDNIKFGGSGFVVGGVYNTDIINSEFTGTHSVPWQWAGKACSGTPPVCSTTANNDSFQNNRFDGYNFRNDYSATHHMECLHSNNNGPNSSIFRNNLVLECPVEGWFVESDTDGFHDNLIEGNVFVATIAGANLPLIIRGHASTGVIQNNVVRFNTFNTSAAWTDNQAAATMSGNVAYGNLNGLCPASDTGFAVSDSVFSGSSCAQDDGSSTFNVTPAWTSSGSPNYDYSLSNCNPGTAANLITIGSVTGYPATDLLGQTRPKTTLLDAGALETC